MTKWTQIFKDLTHVKDSYFLPFTYFRRLLYSFFIFDVTNYHKPGVLTQIYHLTISIGQ